MQIRQYHSIGNKQYGHLALQHVPLIFMHLTGQNNGGTAILAFLVIYPIRVGVLDVVSNSECHEQWRGAAEPLFMALGSWKPSQKHQRGLDMASHTSLHIHSNEAWNYDD